jgi:hypothetical protein
LLKLFKEEKKILFLLFIDDKVASKFFSANSRVSFNDFVFIQHITQQKRNKNMKRAIVVFCANWKNWKINMFYQYLHAFFHDVNTILHFTSSPLSAWIDAEKTGLMDS